MGKKHSRLDRKRMDTGDIFFFSRGRGERAIYAGRWGLEVDSRVTGKARERQFPADLTGTRDGGDGLRRKRGAWAVKRRDGRSRRVRLSYSHNGKEQGVAAAKERGDGGRRVACGKRPL